MTSQEIATLAGVSRSTVSRVLNGYRNVPEETFNKVMSVVKKYDYTPNSSARVLAGKETGVIGLFIVSRSDAHESKIYNNSFVGQFLNALVEIATNYNYFVLLNMIESAHLNDRFLKIKQSFLEKRIDSAIVVDVDDFCIPYLNELIEKNFPVCLIDVDGKNLEINNELNKAFVVNAANYEGAVEAMEYLVRLGHRKIGFVKGEMITYSAKERYNAYEDVMKKYNIAIDSRYVLDGEFSNSKTVMEVKKMLSECKNDLPTAIFCSNDDMAMATINVLTDYGYKIPEDVSVIGFDNLNISKYSVPSLTTVENPIYDIAKKAMETLIDVKKGELTGLQTYEIPVKMILRGSCMAIE